MRMQETKYQSCDDQRVTGFLLAFIAVFFWSFNVIYARYLSLDLTPVQIAFFRWVIAALVFIPFCYKQIIKDYKLLLQNWRLIINMAFFGIALSNTFVYQAAHTATAIDMALIGTMGPIFLVLFSRIILKTPVHAKQIVGMGLSVVGVFIIITHGNLLALKSFKFVIGDFWMLLMAITFGYYGTLQTKRPKNISSFSLLPTTIVTAVVILLPFFIYSLYNSPIQVLPKRTVEIIVYLGVFNSVIAYFCWNTALVKIGSLHTSIIYYFMPILSTIEAYFILNEKIVAGQVYGGLLILIGIILANVHKKPIVPERA